MLLFNIVLEQKVYDMDLSENILVKKKILNINIKNTIAFLEKNDYFTFTFTFKILEISNIFLADQIILIIFKKFLQIFSKS